MCIVGLQVIELPHNPAMPTMEFSIDDYEAMKEEKKRKAHEEQVETRPHPRCSPRTARG